MLSNITTELSPGIIFISPVVVAIEIVLSPMLRLSEAKSVGIPHSPEPSPSDTHVCPVIPGELIPYSTFSDDKTPSSVRSVKFESNA